ncbi:pimeloyl-ACP methyl ester esterase BioH [Thaumasiovibrio subtropicus]|uniref:pimeloyl-ACP methyl ester esterase BioH n=1 Tax=Thaumasiovibrio subtropicus TaxID=1891207 RepID=UPI000B35E7F9|nr:pimeloyl-ACP methyl ester esterase BioH [Thaumasiovibrio subtropicus]
MTTAFNWRTEGEGSDLVLIHGWGMNAAVWQHLLPSLTPHYRVHLVDLPGYGHNHHLVMEDIEAVAALLLAELPKGAVWVGWSLGGLVAKQAALMNPSALAGLVTVASSPCFAEQEDWRGIKQDVLGTFKSQLAEDYQALIERFMAIQAMGSRTARQDIKLLKTAVLDYPQPHPDALQHGLNWLSDIDLRNQLDAINLPWLRMYGRLDGLVPVKVAAELDTEFVHSRSVVFKAASHAPFISHPDEFVEALRAFMTESRL